MDQIQICINLTWKAIDKMSKLNALLFSPGDVIHHWPLSATSQPLTEHTDHSKRTSPTPFLSHFLWKHSFSTDQYSGNWTLYPVH